MTILLGLSIFPGIPLALAGLGIALGRVPFGKWPS
jgi:hypothetical protein